MIICIPVKGYLEVNSYLWANEETRHAFLIDPGARGDLLLDYCDRNAWIPEGILLTHGHFDHIGGVDAIRARQDIPVRIHEAGRAFLENPKLNLSHYFGGDAVLENAVFFRDGDLLSARSGCRGRIHLPRRDLRPSSCRSRAGCRRSPAWRLPRSAPGPCPQSAG